jgi:hypothetical protein
MMGSSFLVGTVEDDDTNKMLVRIVMNGMAFDVTADEARQIGDMLDSWAGIVEDHNENDEEGEMTPIPCDPDSPACEEAFWRGYQEGAEDAK